MSEIQMLLSHPAMADLELLGLVNNVVGQLYIVAEQRDELHAAFKSVYADGILPEEIVQKSRQGFYN